MWSQLERWPYSPGSPSGSTTWCWSSSWRWWRCCCRGSSTAASSTWGSHSSTSGNPSRLSEQFAWSLPNLRRFPMQYRFWSLLFRCYIWNLNFDIVGILWSQFCTVWIRVLIYKISKFTGSSRYLCIRNTTFICNNLIMLSLSLAYSVEALMFELCDKCVFG